MAYHATIASIRTRPHPNADRLLLGVVCNSTVIVGLDTQDDAVGVFFPPDGQLSYEFAKANKLLKEDGGYLEDSRRVKALKLRGVKSEGLWLPLSCLTAVFGDKGWTPGDIIEDARVCGKYETPATIRARNSAVGNARKESVFFPKHSATSQLRENIEAIPVGSLITITEKLHGTSGRYGLVPIDKPYRWWERLLSKWGYNREKWELLVGSRNVVLSKHPERGYYGSEKFRTDVMGDSLFAIHRGEILFGEVVGYTETGQPIMPPNKGVPYAYGNMVGTSTFYLYNVAQWTVNGDILTLPYAAMSARAQQLGLKTPPLVKQFVYGGDPHEIADLVVDFFKAHPTSTLDPSHLLEGVVVRVDTPFGNTYWLKDKTFEFKVAEGIIKDNPDTIDREEAS